MTELAQTKGTFKLIGKVTGVDREQNYQDKIHDKGAKSGTPMRSIRFGVQTSPVNTVNVSMFAFQPDEVYLWNSELKSGGKENYSKWLKNRAYFEKNKQIPLQTRVGINKILKEGKQAYDTQHLPSFDCIAYIHDNLFNGDTVVVEGDISFNTYTNKKDETVTSANYNVTSLFKLDKEIDFNDEKFQETSNFDQELIFTGIDVDKKEKKALIFGKTVNYYKTASDIDLVIDFKEDTTDGMFEKMAKIYDKKVKYGSIIKVHGNIINKAVLEEVEMEEDEDDEILAMLSGEKNAMEKSSITHYISYLQIRGTSGIEHGIYTEDDFTAETGKLVEKAEKEKDEFSGLSGESKSTDDDDFYDDDVEGLDIDDDDLPF